MELNTPEWHPLFVLGRHIVFHPAILHNYFVLAGIHDIREKYKKNLNNFILYKVL